MDDKTDTEVRAEILQAFADIYAGKGTVYEPGDFARLADELEQEQPM